MNQTLPFYQAPTEKERLQHMAQMPHGYRKGLCGKAQQPANIGLFDTESRKQIDMLDYLAASGKEVNPTISPAGK